jgi:hypothetical protein
MGEAQWQNGLLQPYGKLQGSPAPRSCSPCPREDTEEWGKREREREKESMWGLRLSTYRPFCYWYWYRYMLVVIQISYATAKQEDNKRESYSNIN